MVRETRHLWVGNLPENVKEDRIREHFQRYGRVQSVKLLPRFGKDEETGNTGSTSTGSGLCATVAFMDIKSAAKARASENVFEDRNLVTDYYDPLSHESGRPTSMGSSSIPPMPHRGRHSGYNGIGHPDDGYERPSSHFFERRNDSEAGAGSFIRRQGPHHFRERPYRNGPFGQGMNDRGPPGGGCHYRGPAAWGYDSPAPPRYPPQDYMDDRSERSEFASVQSSSMVSATKNRAALITSIKSRKRKSSRSPSRSRSRSDSRSPASSISRSRSPSSGSAGSRSRSRSRSRSLSPRSVSNSRSSSRSSSRSQKTTRSAQSSSPSRSSRSGSSRSPGWARPRPRNCGSQKSGGSQMSGGGMSTSVGSDDRRPLAICVRNLPLRSSDTSLKDGLFHEYKKHGKVVTVKVAGQLADRVAVVRFKKAEDVEKALEVSRDKLFFGCKIEVTPCDSELDIDDNEFRPLEADLDEYHPKATRTLFIGNLEKDVTATELRRYFEDFGTIIEIDIKKQSQSGASASAYAFCQYADIASVVRAMRRLDGEQVGNTRVKLGFGKSMPTNCVWLHGVADTVSEKYLARYMNRFGHVSYVAIDRERCNSLVFYDQVPFAQAAVQELRGRALAGRKLQVDFASRECQAHFFELVEREPRGVNHRFPGAPPGAPLPSAAAAAAATSLSAARAARTPSANSRSREKDRTLPSTETRSRQGTSREDSFERELDVRDGLGSESREQQERWRSQTSPAISIKTSEDKDEPSTAPAAISNGRSSSKGRFDSDDKNLSPVDISGSASPVTELRRDRGTREMTVERDRSRRFGSGGSSSSGLSVDTSVQPPATSNGTDVFSQIRDSADTTSSGEEQVSDSECRISGASGGKKSKLSGSSDSGVSDVSVGDQLVSTVCSTSSVTKPTSAAPAGGQPSSLIKAALINRPSRRVSRLSTDSSGDCKDKDKHALPKTIPGEVHIHRKSQDTSTSSSRPGTPLCDENSEEMPTDPRKGRPARAVERPMNLPLPRFALEFLGSSSRRPSLGMSSTASSSPVGGASQLTSSDSAFRMPTTYSVSNSPTRAAVPGSPRGSVVPETHLDMSDSESSPGSSPRAALHSADASLAEQLRQWEQRYEQWSTRSMQTPSIREVERLSHKPPLRNLDDLKAQEPSDIVRCLLAKHSVFDEDQKRLESVRDKYEPDMSVANFSQIKAQVSVLNFKAELPVSTASAPSPVVSPLLTKTAVVTPRSPLTPVLAPPALKPELVAEAPGKDSPVEPITGAELIKSPEVAVVEKVVEPVPTTPPISPPVLQPRPPTPPLETPAPCISAPEPAVERRISQGEEPMEIVEEPCLKATKPSETSPQVERLPPPVQFSIPEEEAPVTPVHESEPVAREPKPVEEVKVEARVDKPDKEIKETKSEVKLEFVRIESKSSKDKNGQRSRHSSTNSHRKEKEREREKSREKERDKEKEKEKDREKEKEKDKEKEKEKEKEAEREKEKERDMDEEKIREMKIVKEKDVRLEKDNKLDVEFSRRKSRDAESSTDVAGMKRRKSVDAGQSASKKMKTDKDKTARDSSREGEREKSKNHDKENKEALKSQKSENRTETKFPVTSLSKKPESLSKSPRSSTDYFGERSSSKTKSKKEKKDKDRDKDRDKEREEKDRDKEKREKEKEKEKEKRKEEERAKEKEKNKIVASAALLSATSRRKSDAEKAKVARVDVQRSSSQRSSTSSRKKSHSDSESLTDEDLSACETDLSNDDSDDEHMSGRKSNHGGFFDSEPTYFSMYDKVKARSLKLQQQKQQQEERRQQQQVGKFGAFRQARHSGSRSKDDKKLHWDTSESDSESPARSNRPRPLGSAMAMSRLSSASSDEDSDPFKLKSEKAETPDESVPARISSKRNSLASRSKVRQLLSSQSDSESGSDPEKSKKLKNITEPIAKRRPSAPEMGSAKQTCDSKNWQRSLSSGVTKKKKESKSSSGTKLSARGEEKMENIFGPLSDESDDHQSRQTGSSSKLRFSSVYGSDSDSKPVAPEKVRTPSPVERKKKKSKTRERNRSRKSESRSEPENAQLFKSTGDLESDADDLAEAGRALESKLLEDNPEPVTEAVAVSLAVLPAERKSSKKKKKSKRSSREERSSKDNAPAEEVSSLARDSGTKESSIKEDKHSALKEQVAPKEMPVITAPPAIRADPPGRLSPEPVHVWQAAMKQEPQEKTESSSPLSMPNLWEPAAAAPLDKRPVICKLETEDAVAGLLMETFDDERYEHFNDNPLEEEPVDQQAQPAQVEDSTPSEEALKAVQSLQCENDMEITQEMLMETETESSGVTTSPEADAEAKIRSLDNSSELAPSPSGLLIDETPSEASPVKEEKAPQTPDVTMVCPRTPDIEVPPRTPEAPSPAASRYPRSGEKSVIQHSSPCSSPPKASPRPVVVPRQLPGYRRSSRNSISEPSNQDVYTFTDNEVEESRQAAAERTAPVPQEHKPDLERPAPTTAAPVLVQQQPAPSPGVTVITSPCTPATPVLQPVIPAQPVQPQEPFDLLRKAPDRSCPTPEKFVEKIARPLYIGDQLKVMPVITTNAASPRHSPRAAPLPLAKVSEPSAPSVLKVELPQLVSAVISKETSQVGLVDPVTGLQSPVRWQEEPVLAASAVVRNLRAGPVAPHPPVSMANAASEVVRHLPPTTVLTPVATKPATLAAYPDVPLTRDVPPSPQHQATATPLGSHQPAQQHTSPAPLTLPAGVPVSLSGGATVIAVASSNRATPSTPMTRHTASGTTVHLSSQPLPQSSGATTIVRSVSTSTAQPSVSVPRLAASTTLVPVSSVQHPPASALRTTVSVPTTYTQAQSVPTVGLVAARPSPAPVGASVTVLPATSRPPSSAGTSGVSVYPVYGPPSTSVVSTSSSRVTITTSTTARSTPSATPPAQSPFRPTFADPMQHYHAYHGAPAQHSPATPSIRDEVIQNREDERSPASVRPSPVASFPEAPMHPHTLHELPTPPPAHQHQHHAWHQQVLYHQMLRSVQQGALAKLAYSPAPGQHPVSDADRERERNPSMLPLHLRGLTSGGEHRSTESPLQGSIPMLPLGQNYHRPGSGTSIYSSGHMLDRASPSQQPRQTLVPYIPEESGYQSSPPPAHLAGVLRATPNNGPSPASQPTPASEAPLPLIPAGSSSRPLSIRTPPHASQVPPQADSLVMLLQRYPIMWQGLLALKNDHAVVQMHFISGNPHVARGSLPLNPDGSTLPLRVAQRMRLEQQQLEGVARKMRIEEEHCILLALPCGRDAMDVLQQSNNLSNGFITYLQLKQAAGIVNIAAPGSQQASYVVHIFPSCDFANESLARITPDLLHRVADIAHLLVIIATV